MSLCAILFFIGAMLAILFFFWIPRHRRNPPQDLLTILLCCGLALGGCSAAREMGGALAGTVSVNTNIPYHGTNFPVVNQTDGQFNVFIDGQPSASVAPGGHQALSFYDFSGGYGQHSVLVTGPKGSSYRTVSVSGQSQASDVWIVAAGDLRR